MADLKITDLASAVSVDDSDFLVVDTGVDTLKSTAALLREAMTGNLASLKTTAKTSAVAAINEVHDEVENDVLYFTSIACSAMTGNFATKSDAAITADHVVVSCEFASPNSVSSNATWATTNGSLTLNGTCSSSTSANVILAKKSN